MIEFAHPLAGALALLGLPAILLIHFLQLPARPVASSTLFLLETLAPESTGGRRLQRLRQSVPLWLQLLAVLLIAWVLAQPRWMQPQSTQSVVVVLDSSLSMQAFRKELATLPERLQKIASGAARSEWIVLESDPAAPTLYHGEVLSQFAEALTKWEPRLGFHDTHTALVRAQALVRDHGLVVFVSDHDAAVPPGVALLAIGHPLENSGWIGLSTEGEGWEALIRHYGSTPQTRHWSLETLSDPPTRSTPQPITLVPGQSLTLRGTFPSEAQKIRLRLDPPDPFPLDDTLPLIRPKLKPLTLTVAMEPQRAAPHRGWIDAFLRSTPASRELPQGKADLQIVPYDPLSPTKVDGPALRFIDDPAPLAQKKLLSGLMMTERDPLVEGLNWNGLLIAESFSFTPVAGDLVLLWQGKHPLLIRRGEQLLLGFDPVQSNAARLPAFAILLHRYAESVRAGLQKPEQANVELAQPLNAPPGAVLKSEGGTQQGGALHAPAQPGFFSVEHQGPWRLDAAAHFADPREADFSAATTLEKTDDAIARQRERHLRPDRWATLWLLLLGGVFVLNWNWRERR